MSLIDENRELGTEERKDVSDGRNVAIPAGRALSDAELLNVSGGVGLDRMTFEPSAPLEPTYSLKNIYQKDE